MEKKRIYLAIAVCFIVILVAVSIVIFQKQSEKNSNLEVDENKNKVSSYVQENKNSVSYPVEIDKEADLRNKKGESFEDYGDWKLYSYSSKDYTPYYSNQEFPGISFVIASELHHKRLEITGGYSLTIEFKPALLSIIKLLEESTQNDVVVLYADGEVDEFKDKWKSIPGRAVVVDKVYIKDTGYPNIMDLRIFTKNNLDGTWTAAFQGTELSDKLVESIPDEYFPVHLDKDAFYD